MAVEMNVMLFCDCDSVHNLFFFVFFHFNNFTMFIRLVLTFFTQRIRLTTDTIIAEAYAKSNMKSYDDYYYSYCYNEASYRKIS